MSGYTDAVAIRRSAVEKMWPPDRIKTQYTHVGLAMLLKTGSCRGTYVGTSWTPTGQPRRSACNASVFVSPGGEQMPKVAGQNSLGTSSGVRSLYATKAGSFP